MAQGTETQQQPAQPAPLFSRAFIMMALVNLMVFAGFQMISTGMPVYVSQLGASNLQIGLVTTLTTTAAVLCRPFVGTLVDSFGRRGFLAGGLVILVLVVLSYTAVPVVGFILAMRFVNGLGWGFASTANSTIITDILPRKRFAEGMGYYAMTNSLALAVAPALAIWLIEVGQSQLMIYAAALFTVLSLVVCIVFFATTYQQPPLKERCSVREAFAPANLFEKSALFPSGIMFIIALSYGSIVGFIALLGASRGISHMSLYFIIYAVVNVLTRPFVGRLVDARGYLAPGVAACLCIASSLSIIAFAHSLLAICIAGALVGFGLGTAMSVFQTMSVAIALPWRRGAANSTYFTLWDAGLGLGALVAGLLVELSGYTGMFLCMAALAVLACVLFLAGGRQRIESYHQKQVG